MASTDLPPDAPGASVAGVLAHAARTFPERTAFVGDGVRWTYAEVARRASRLAGLLRQRGVGPGDVIAWAGDNTPHAALAYFGAAWAGAVLAPLHLRLTDADLRRVLAHADARVLLVEPEFAARAASLGAGTVSLHDASLGEGAGPAAVPRGAGDAAHLYYTSGSTGTPKGVVLTHGNVTSHARLAAQALGLGADDVWLHAAPMFHLADAWATFSVTLVGGAHRFVPRFDADAVLRAFADGVTATNLVPTMWRALVRHPRAASTPAPSLRLLLSGGAAVDAGLVARLRATFGAGGRAEYVQTYGLTETSPFLTFSRLSEAERRLPEAEALARLTRAGHAMPGVEVEVLDAAGRPVPADGVAVGEVVARGPTVTPGYLHHPAATAAAFRDGWFCTGDLARRFPDGRIDLVDRRGDVVNSGGEKVFTTDVERALAAVGGLAEAVAVGVPDPHWGEVVAVVAVLDPTATRGPCALDDLRARLKGLPSSARLADFKLPRHLVLVDALPRTASGKLDKRTARALAAAHVASAGGGGAAER